MLLSFLFFFFFFNDTATTEIYTLSLHDALPICRRSLSLTPRGPSCSCSRARSAPSPRLPRHTPTPPAARPGHAGTQRPPPRSIRPRRRPSPAPLPGPRAVRPLWSPRRRPRSTNASFDTCLARATSVSYSIGEIHESHGCRRPAGCVLGRRPRARRAWTAGAVAHMRRGARVWIAHRLSLDRLRHDRDHGRARPAGRAPRAVARLRARPPLRGVAARDRKSVV